MALVLSERDYKILVLFTKIAGIFLWAAGSIMLLDHGKPALGLGLIALGTVVTLAPVPMTVVRPDSLPEGDDDQFTVNE
ncbi:MAG: hypothetical protein QOI63_49 [Thermoplasmata archaeon]|jgi:hypothetical protein|nr:hypothetical protein [Thermoplasmata archaeon]